jgi:uncharacterized cysteine cluster protein YcgN (CxxCxxCC family)
MREEIREIIRDWIVTSEGRDIVQNKLLFLFQKTIEQAKPDSYEEGTNWCGDECIDKALDKYEDNLKELLK